MLHDLSYLVIFRAKDSLCFPCLALVASLTLALTLLEARYAPISGKEKEKAEQSLNFSKGTQHVSYFLLGVVLCRFWVLTNVTYDYERFTEFACYLAPLALLAVWLFDQLVLEHGALLSLDRWGDRHTSILLLDGCVIFWQCIMILGFAGPMKAKQTSTNLAAACLSWERLAWMAELALPLYMTNHIVCDLLDKALAKLFADSFVCSGIQCSGQLAWQLGPWYAWYIVVQFVAIHAVAWAVWKALLENRAQHSNRVQ